MNRRLSIAVLSAILTLSGCASSRTGSSASTTPPTSSPSTTVPALPMSIPATTEGSTQVTPTVALTSPIEPVSSAAGVTTDAPDETTPATGVEETISADYQTDQNLYWAVVFSPSTDNLEARVAQFSVPGEQIFSAVVKGVQDLVRVGDTYEANDPDVRRDAVESVYVDGPTTATVTVCTVDNSKRITPASKSPTGSVIEEDNTGQLVAARLLVTMKLSGGRWRQASYAGDALGIWKGQDHCEPA